MQLQLSGEGVVLHSSDDGLNWTIVYRSPDVRSLNALGRSDGGGISGPLAQTAQ
jgi:hypothetical protein